MNAVRCRLAVGGLVAAVAIVALAWLVGGQLLLRRIDPALALPWLFPPMLVAARWLRVEAARTRRRVMMGVLVVAAVLQASLCWWFAGRIAWDQLALIVAAGAVAAFAADAIVQWRAGRGRWMSALMLAFAWFVAGHILLAFLYRPAAAPAARPAVTMLTGLPLRWAAEGDMTALIAEGGRDDPALIRLEAMGDVTLVDSLVDHVPPAGAALLLAHPRALAPQELVAIDAFVRGGGRAVVLADALSNWPPRHPLGDPRNAPVTSLLTPLLDHWGIRLGAAATGDPRPQPVDVGPARLRLFSAGRFETLPIACRAFADNRVASCPIGKGRVWLIGDADLLFTPMWQSMVPIAPHLRPADTMDWLALRLWGDDAMSGWRMQPQWIRARAP